ncbi:MAG: tRNA pseudouridine(38-40) synthase TruA, partial [Oscillospiraceae bacterium]|nr:tRNA pseudouridine(38-40) synthase TruA [Oscillospiraceae bacterium]
MRNLKVTMAYRGTAYHGYQIQNNGITVQEVVERCAGKVLNEPITLHGCSRTDAGVHARQFCFSVQTNSQISPLGFIRGVNGELPKDISILSCEDVPLDFHARFSCKGKEYLYLIHNSECK